MLKPLITLGLKASYGLQVVLYEFLMPHIRSVFFHVDFAHEHESQNHRFTSVVNCP